MEVTGIIEAVGKLKGSSIGDLLSHTHSYHEDVLKDPINFNVVSHSLGIDFNVEFITTAKNSEEKRQEDLFCQVILPSINKYTNENCCKVWVNINRKKNEIEINSHNCDTFNFIGILEKAGLKVKEVITPTGAFTDQWSNTKIYCELPKEFRI